METEISILTHSYAMTHIGTIKIEEKNVYEKNTNLNMLGEKITLVNNIRKHSFDE